MVKTEDILNKLSPDWDGIREITVYGFGRTAVRNVDRLAEDFRIALIIDNDPEIHGKQYRDCRVQTFEEARGQLSERKIVVATSSVAYADIKKTASGGRTGRKPGFLPFKGFYGRVVLERPPAGIPEPDFFLCDVTMHLPLQAL